MKKRLSKIKNWFFYRTSTHSLGEYTITDVKPRFRAIRPKRKYKTCYTIIDKDPIIITQ